MQFTRIAKALPASLAALGAALIAFLLLGGEGARAGSLAKRVAGTDMAGKTREQVAVAIEKASTLTVCDGVPAAVEGAWPCFRGAKLDGIGTERAPLAREWGPEGPPVLWTIDVGEGYAGAAVLNGRVYLIDYDREAQADVVRCLSLADGRDIWRFSYPVPVKRNHGMSRTVPAVTPAYVVTLGPKCHVVCLNAETGAFVWAIDLVRAWKAKVPQWYAGQCPLIDRDRVILAPGGDALLIAVELATGKVLWQSPNPGRWQMTHATPMPMELRGTRMYVYPGSGGVAGIAAEDGALLWQTDAWKISIATVPSPVIAGGGRVFLTGGYNAGAMMLKIDAQDGAFAARTLYTLDPKVFASIQQTPILYQERLFAVKYDGQLACADLDGRVLWTSGSGNTFGLGPYALAQGLLYVVNDKGRLTLVDAGAGEYRRLAEFEVLQGHDAWGPLAIAGGRLIMRDFTRMVCLDIRDRAARAAQGGVQ
ncbi:MAG TPA: PQQ-like beta-propeller repeat protein [Planctomycetota bacterium]|jgi:outer membrane protein assembly factor BamB|nr:PQQ-like beta-propeller repeat protein [Planctomycetota bacterium]OQC18999.1 MAG: outer membrane biogenesis protein BamB [Planctomycetes bacterium ADurb.Bin069]NMD35421.1 PQQ-binding-like beta-propeller repeat protein [Planctomycetota bacterium]HNR99590.1 PQQ-like beta-propeller repeat protein [Planctomycetota bacterium]HNU26474.1 PQQ-like beta-propeller repeat protein [Planctomycetota bacterium]